MAKSHPRGIILALVFFVLLLTIGCATPRAYIGVELDAYNLVKKVVPDKPAQQAGIRPGDIVSGSYSGLLSGLIRHHLLN